MENNNAPQKVFWIGDHAKTILENTDKTVLNQFTNKLLLYDRVKSTKINGVNKFEPTFLTEFSPMIERKYKVDDLSDPMHLFLKDNVPKKKCLFIGDPGEVLFQSVVDSGANFSDFESNEVGLNIFEEVNKNTSKILKHKLDLTQHDILFLKVIAPFEDLIEEAMKYKGLGEMGFNNCFEVKNNQSELNEFLWKYGEDPNSIKETGYLND